MCERSWSCDFERSWSCDFKRSWSCDFERSLSCYLGHLIDEGDSVELSLTDIRLRLVFNLSKYSSLLCTRLDSKPRQRADSSLSLALVLVLQEKIMILLVENMFPSCFESPHRNNSTNVQK